MDQKGGENVEKGDMVIFVDPYGEEHNALVTAVWQNPSGEPSVNVVYVSDDLAKEDQYGRQIERNTSVVHESNQSAHGMKWRRLSVLNPDGSVK